MTSINYETIFSRSRNKMNDLREIMSLSDEDLLEVNMERLHSVIGDARIQYIFKDFDMEDDVQTIMFELKNPSTTFFDKEFIIELFANGIVISWLRPQVESYENIAVMIGGKEEKTLINKYDKVISRLETLENNQRKALRDRGYRYNGYLQEEES